MARAQQCPQCRGEVTADAPEGLCPECLFQQGLAAQAFRPAADFPLRSSPSLSPFLPPQPAELAADFPQLEILQLLGQGGMGAVYKARQKKLDRLVALKILPLEAGRDPAFAERFAREARALARLNHPNVVGIHDFGEIDGLYYFVMEYVDGLNLRQLLEAGQLPPDEALRIIPQLCDALQYAHEEEIVHRDIKPENILLTRRGRVKVADFGLAKLLVPGPVAYHLTGSQQVMGTPYYMAPEQLQKSRTVDHRADIYSLGVVFYEMLTGELPLGRFAPPSQHAAVDRRLDDVVFRTLEREPERRYQRVSEVKGAVEAITVGAAPAGPVPAWRQSDGPARLHVRLANGTAALLWLGSDALFLEYNVGWFSPRFKEVRIPLAEVEGLRLEKGFWGWYRMKVRCIRLSTLAEIPQSTGGEATLVVGPDERALAERFVAQVSRQISAAAAPVAPPPRREGRVGLWSVNVPAVGLVLTGSVALCWSFAYLHKPFGPPKILIVAALAAALTVIAGGVCLWRRKSRRLVLAASVLAMLPWSPAVAIGLPLGLWALFTERRQATLAALRLPGAVAGRVARAAVETGPKAIGPVRRKVQSFLGSMRSLFLASRVQNPAARPHGPVPTQDYRPRPEAEPPVP